MSEELQEILKRIKDFNYYGWLTKKETSILNNYIEQLQKENEKLKKYCCKRNECSGRLKDNYKLTDSEVLTEFEKWLEEEINIIEDTYSQINGNYMRMQPILDTFKKCKDRLQELKGGKK